MKQFEGIYPAIITPIDENEEINEKALAQVIEKTIGQGVSGFYVSGSTGESFLLRDEQRVQLIKAVCAIVDGRCDVIANIGTFSTRASIKMANAAAECGVTAISAVPPFYFSYSKREIVQYYFDIAEASGMPVILYNIPKMSGRLLRDGGIGRAARARRDRRRQADDHGPHADGGAGKDLPGQGRVQRA